MVNPLFRSATVGTVMPDWVLPWTRRKTLIVTEKEDLVLDDRTANRSSELILPQLALVDVVVVFKPIRRVEDVIAEKFPGGAVDAVGARLDRGVQNSSGSSAKLGAKVPSLDFEFLRSHRAGGSTTKFVPFRKSTALELLSIPSSK